MCREANEIWVALKPAIKFFVSGVDCRVLWEHVWQSVCLRKEVNHIFDRNKEQMLEKIKKCLAFVESSNPHEAEAALRQARKLVDKFHLVFSDAYGKLLWNRIDLCVGLDFSCMAAV
ncbi:TPA: DUF2786 domain-containing protein [Pseudomonas aeruginosa]|uniref:DUF2786 domain-containing protein n=1 Tax=Pseudomonas aeruginosa TaxID=287 RepID=UPI000AAA9AAD|nr:DUF2786 domain-containing protein [Pseudomonas aeruginosa]